MNDGTVVTYDLRRGFGFIRCKGFREDVFVHASDIHGAGGLKAGQRVRFSVETTDRGPRAKEVEPGVRGLPPWALAAVGLTVVVGLLGYGFFRLGLGILGAVFVAWNLATWLVYGWDKRQAGSEGRRVPEVVLLGMALAGGSPGAGLGMWAFRHKLRKRSFMTAFFAILLLQGVAAYFWYSRG